MLRKHGRHVNTKSIFRRKERGSTAWTRTSRAGIVVGAAVDPPDQVASASGGMNARNVRIGVHLYTYIVYSLVFPAWLPYVSDRWRLLPQLDAFCIMQAPTADSATRQTHFAVVYNHCRSTYVSRCVHSTMSFSSDIRPRKRKKNSFIVRSQQRRQPDVPASWYPGVKFEPRQAHVSDYRRARNTRRLFATSGRRSFDHSLKRNSRRKALAPIQLTVRLDGTSSHFGPFCDRGAYACVYLALFRSFLSLPYAPPFYSRTVFRVHVRDFGIVLMQRVATTPPLWWYRSIHQFIDYMKNTEARSFSDQFFKHVYRIRRSSGSLTFWIT